ncbi:hypothetical protein Vi05172_g5392 [Venturia inaequalis]|nr:hypothetical protein Vi05172_g5392 [Venturia inaequalis]
MQFLSITTVLFKLILLQGVAAQYCTKNPTNCDNKPCNTTKYSNADEICNAKCGGAKQAVCCGDYDLYCF